MQIPFILTIIFHYMLKQKSSEDIINVMLGNAVKPKAYCGKSYQWHIGIPTNGAFAIGK